MTASLGSLLVVPAAIGAGLSTGVYLAFSLFVMPGLRSRPPRDAIMAMNAINQAAPRNPLLMLVLFGTGLTCAVLLVVGIVHRHGSGAPWLIVGTALYLLSVVILVGYHIPHNEQLMRTDVAATRTSEIWARFYTLWMMWNHLRSVTAAAGATCLIVSMTGVLGQVSAA